MRLGICVLEPVLRGDVIEPGVPICFRSSQAKDTPGVQPGRVPCNRLKSAIVWALSAVFSCVPLLLATIPDSVDRKVDAPSEGLLPSESVVTARGMFPSICYSA